MTKPPDIPPYFAASEMEDLNSGIYHDCRHAFEVAELVYQMACRAGHSSERAEFLRQVGLIHDADLRFCPDKKDRHPGTPARVQVTLEWMLSERALLEQRFGWSELLFSEALALVARTDFPFDQNPRCYGTRFDGRSPHQVYRGLLTALSAERQEQCLVDALMLRFADQVAAYVGPFRRASDSVRNLVSELNNVGVALTFESCCSQTPGFLENAGRDLDLDIRLANDLGFSQSVLPSRDALLDHLSWKQRLQLAKNLWKFQNS